MGAQRFQRVSKETVVETVRKNLAELRARHDWNYCSSGDVTRPSEPGPTAVANEAAAHQTDADAASARSPISSDLVMAGIDWGDLDHGWSDYDRGHDDDDEYDDDYDGIWEYETTWYEGSTTTPTTATGEE